MSDRIRRMLRARQNAMMAMAQMNMLNLGSRMPLQQQMAPEEQAPPQEKSMARQILDRYMAMKSRTLQEELAQDETGALMAPMISSVMQLDR